MLTGNKRVELSTLFIFVEIMVYIYILLVYNSDQEVEVNLDYTYKRRMIYESNRNYQRARGIRKTI